MVLRQAPTARSVRHAVARQPSAMVDLTVEDDEEIPKFNPDLEDDDDDSIEIIREVTPIKRASSSSIKLEAYKIGPNEIIKPGVVVQLADGDFLRVSFIQQDVATHIVALRGNLLRRNKFVDDMLPKKMNEVCLVMQATHEQDQRVEDCLVTKPMADYVCIREKVFFTNQDFPLWSFRHLHLDNYNDWDDVYNHAQLVCHWKHTETLDASGSKVVAASLQRLSDHECDKPHRCPDLVLLRNFLDARMPRGPDQRHNAEHKPAATSQKVNKKVQQASSSILFKSTSSSPKKRAMTDAPIEIISDDEDDDLVIIEEQATSEMKRMSIDRKKSRIDEQQTMERYLKVDKMTTPDARSSRLSPASRVTLPLATSRHSYTFGDLCSGAGGMARGAEQAGLRLNWLLDHWPDACDTLQFNFNAKVMLKEIFDFCNQRAYSWERVDVLHVSFPCCPHSPAHTVAGRNDDANIAAGYSVGPILKRCKPRIVTFEQTSGILTHRGGFHMRALIRQIVDEGYSVRWKICNLAEYGNSQPRKRLIIIAAAPGQILPTFPKTTHGAGKKPFVTVGDCLRKLEGHVIPDNMTYSYPKNEESYDPSFPLRSAITCNGGVGNLHPSGRRTFNLQELALLQGFPLMHRFSGNPSSIKKQIGNAVPSVFARTLYQHIIRTLEESDRQLLAYRPPMIQIDDDDE